MFSKGAAVRKVKEHGGRITLEQSLRPLWMATYYGCVLLDWCRTIPDKSRLSVIVHCVGISLSLLVVIVGFVFQFCQLSLEMMKENATIHSVIPNLIWSCNYPITLDISIGFLVLRPTLLSFFQDWSLMEQNLIPSQKYAKLKRMHYIVYGIYASMLMFLFYGTFNIMLRDPEASFLLSHYPIFRETLTIPGVFAFHMVSGLLGWALTTLGNLVPAWTFYHAGKALRSLADEFEQNSSQINPASSVGFQQIRLRYERVDNLVGRANRLFGWLIVTNHSVLFFMVCTLLYILLSTFRQPDHVTWISYFFGMMAFVVPLLVSTLMAAHLHISAGRLRLVVSIALNREILDPEESVRATHFLSRMKESPLAARPLNLYDMKPSTLLTITSLTITYVIVLLQTK